MAKQGFIVHLVWISGYKGIQGYEQADRLANEVAIHGYRPKFKIPIQEKHFAVLAKSVFSNKFQLYLDRSAAIKGQLYDSMHRNVSPKPWLYNKALKRDEVVTISRIRSNHYNLAYSLQTLPRKGIMDSPECFCGDPNQDINHLLFYCSQCIGKSGKLRSYLKKIFPTHPIDIRSMINNLPLTLCRLICAYLKSVDLNV